MRLDQRGQIPGGHEGIITLGVAAVVAAFIGWELFATLTSPEVQHVMHAAEAWCHARGGDLVNARAFGEHGGLHCDLPNGTLVEMDDVPMSAMNESLNQTVTPPPG